MTIKLKKRLTNLAFLLPALLLFGTMVVLPFIVYDSQIFDQQKFGGISRYFCEIMSNLQFNYDIALRYTENHYLLNSKIKRHGIYIPHLFFKYHQQKLYQSNAKLILKLMQKHAPFVYHPTYYNPLFLKQIGNNPFVITVLQYRN